MARTAADVLVDTLIAWKVDTIFGMPGDGINGIMEALRLRRDQIRFIQTRHEESAAFMACAHAKFTGRLGVCLATSGPGGIHLLNGLYDAKLDGAPVLAITGLQFHDLIGTHTQQDVELDKLFMDVAVHNTRIMGGAHVENVVSLACRTALAQRGVAHVTMPVDLQSEPMRDDPRSARNVAHDPATLMAGAAMLPTDDQLARAATVLNAGQKICILAGQGALGARSQISALAERLGAPVVTPLLGKGAIPDDSPYATGGAGLLGTRPSQEALEACDTLLIIGGSFPYIEYYPAPDQARAIQIDINPARIGLRHPVEAGLVGDSARVIEALMPRLTHHENRSFLTKAQSGMEDWRALLAERGTRRDSPMKPQVVTHELDPLLDDDAIIVTDSGTVTTWVARYITMRGKMAFSCSGTLSTMACGVPYAIAAALAWPDRQVVCVIGDGALSMLLGELATIRRYGLNIKIIVIKNDSLGQIKWEQIVFLGNPEYECDLEPIDFATVARGFGLDAVTITDAADCGRQLAEAMAAPGAVVIEAVVDPHEPPMPPKATLQQAAHMARALARGTPEGGKIARTIGTDVVRELL
ncbi:MAG: thiamine pyrophosphate-dependent enzyme [Paracoccaceae bacterium]